MITVTDIKGADIQLFADGAAPSAASGADAASADAGATAANTPGTSRRATRGETANVVYGVQDDVPAQQDDTAGSDAGSEKTPEEKRAEFKKLIKEQYKQEFSDEFESIFKRRHKTAQEDAETLASLRPALDALSGKYGTGNDYGKLAEAIRADTVLWENEADDAGMTPEQYVEFQRLKLENARLKASDSERQAQVAAREQVGRWAQEAEELKGDYPGFDLGNELSNPQFVAMLKNGVPVRHAYEVMHIDDIKSNIQRTTAQATEKRVSENMRARGARPQENGAQNTSGIIYKNDVSQLTKKDRAEIARRAGMGEIIKFGR